MLLVTEEHKPGILAIAGLELAMVAFVAWLGYATATTKFHIGDGGLTITNHGKQRFIPWSEIKRLDLRNPVNVLFIRGHGETICMTSTDFFPGIANFVKEIAARSGCELSRSIHYRLANNIALGMCSKTDPR